MPTPPPTALPAVLPAVARARPADPTWVAATPREAFLALGRFAAADSRRTYPSVHVGAHLEGRGIAERFAAFARREDDKPGVRFLREAVEYGAEVLEFDPDAWVAELARAALGAAAPYPERMLPHCEQVVRAFFTRRLCGRRPPPGRFDLFATEGAAAALGYTVRTLLANRMLAPGDRVAVGNSVLIPYVDFPHLGAYGFDVVEVAADPGDDWQFPDPEIDKLADPAVKAFFVANPGGPHLHAIRQQTLDRIATIVRRYRPDLLVVSDDGFGTFVDGFRSLAAALPASALSVYSFSRHFGARGWRLGIVALHQDNAFDCMLEELPDADRAELDRRYANQCGERVPLKFIDRMVAESRFATQGHAAGLSSPQQAQLSLFALFCLTDAGNAFIDATAALLLSRQADLYRGLGLPKPQVPAAAPYYAVVDMLDLARIRHGEDFAAWLRRAGDPEDVVAALPRDCAALLAPGAPNPSGWTVRLSLAGCPDEGCAALGAGLVSVLDGARTTYGIGRPRRSPGDKPSDMEGLRLDQSRPSP